MSAVLISTKGQIVLPISVRNALGLKPGMRVNVKVDGKKALLTLAPEKKTVALSDIQALLKYDGPTIPISAMRVTDYKA
jgi:AbrB family looped-hinge helix DNA binding protein